MARPKNDGRGRLGGRQKGTTNKEKPMKVFLREHSLDYYTPKFEEKDHKGNPTGRLLSQFDLDMRALDPKERVNAEIALLKFHTPQMQASAVDMTLSEEKSTLSDRLVRLSNGEDIAADEE